MSWSKIIGFPRSAARYVKFGLRGMYIRLVQEYLVRRLPKNETKLIVFLTPGYDWRGGGVLSIASLYQESKLLESIHGARVVLCTIPGDPAFLKYTWFKNDNYILNLKLVLRRCRNVESMMLHIPEYTPNRVAVWLDSEAGAPARRIKNMHINVLVQNIDWVEGQNVAGLLRFGKVTCTTAHEAYSNLEMRKTFGVPLHRLSVCGGPENFKLVDYKDKEPLLVVSPDKHPLKEKILAHITKSCPQLKVQIIRNLSYEDYKKLVARAKYSLTFGEGLDGYFCEPVFSGGVGFAVYNDRFFTPPFAKLETVYPSWEALEEKIVADLVRLDQPEPYRVAWKSIYDPLGDIYSVKKFRGYFRDFYLGNYTFP